jgi:ribulose-5-phosphate 4-epimerase/fuculose-1-phosphate aldolase
MFLMKKHDLLYTEVNASNLAKVSMDEDLDEKSGVNRPGFTLHGGVLGARADVNCAVHMHTPIGTAIGAMKDGLRMVSQPAVRFYNRIGYHAYEGITEDFAERERINKDLGNNRAMIMHNHGLLTVGKTAREAFVLMHHLHEAAEIQLRIDATGRDAIEIPPSVCAKTAEQYEHHDAGRGSHDWAAYLRILDKVDTSYRT